ncbi:MAG: T9SS type A sorting domain-containing protein [Bacteroidales bacterium]|nr:T9SS type A sorting domain-containing protein [Bacteroidales bacterium]
MKRILLLLFLFSTAVSQAQVPTDQDCLGAIPVCQDIYVQPNAYSGTGNYPNEIPSGQFCPGNCMNSGEKNDVWYIFTVQTGGDLGFTITPNAMSDDYDWAVYSLNQYKCQDIYAHVAQMQVSCNWSGTPGVTGPNGNSTLHCQNAGGSPYNAKIPVLEGETYVINISNFTSSQSGYTLDFSGSTAQIYDDVAPEIAEVYSDDIICGTTEITFDFTEKVKCNTVSAGKFKLTGPGGPYEVTDVYGDDCEIGGEMEKTYHLSFTPPIYESGEYALEIRPLSFIQDACGNNAPAQSFPFDVELDSPIASAGEDIDIAYSGVATLDGSATGGTGEYSYEWVPVEKLEDPNIEDPTTVNLTESTGFTVTVTDDNSTCRSSDDMMVNIVGGPMSVDAIATPPAVCSGDQTDLNANVTGGSGNFTFSWTSNPPGFVSDIQNPSVNPMVTTTYFVEVDDGFTIINAQVTVNVLPKPIVNAGADQVINVGTVTTLEGSATDGQQPYSFLWEPSYMLDGPNNIAQPTTIVLTEPQNYTLMVTDASGCPGEPDVVLINTSGDALSAFPQSDPQEICIGASATLVSNAVGGGGNYTYTWTSSDTSWSATGDNILINPETTTTYFLEVTDGFTTTTAHVIVPVHPLPVINLVPAGSFVTGEDTVSVCVRDTVLLDAGHPDNPPEMEYMWSNGLSNRYLTAKTNGNWIDFQNFSVDVTNTLTTCSNSSEITIVFDFNQCQIGVDENNISVEAQVSIHPNPNSGIFTIATEQAITNMEIQMTNLVGVVVFSKNYFQIPANGWDDTIDLSNQPKGVYLLHIKADGKLSTLKVVIK